MKDKVSTEERTYTKQEMMEVLAKVNSYIKILEDEISELKDEKKEEGEEGSDEDAPPSPPIDFRMKFPKFFRNLGLF
jgi:CO dehydrogenase/acetyl-CoA synthase beta subunit